MAKDLLLEIAAHAADRELLDIFMHTNFQIATPTGIKETIDAGVNHICVAVDAISKDTYKQIRGGDFSVVLDNLKFLSQYKKRMKLAYPIVRVSAVPCHENRHELARFAEFWSPYADVVEIQSYFFDPAHRTESPYCHGKDHRLLFTVEAFIYLASWRCRGLLPKDESRRGRLPGQPLYRG